MLSSLPLFPLLPLIALFSALSPSPTTANSHLNATCMAQKFANLEVNLDRKFRHGYERKELLDARIESVDSEHNVELVALWSLPHVENDTRTASKQTLRANEMNRLISPRKGIEEDVSDALFIDQINLLGLSAKMTTKKDNELYLTVATGNATTSCSFKLSAHVAHGRVLSSDPNFAFFRFSPDGKYLAYTAEEHDPHYLKYLSRHVRHHGKGKTSSPKPVVILYHVESMTFSKLSSVPRRYTVGQLNWHPDAKTLIGVAWKNWPYLPKYLRSTNKENFLFAMDIEDTYFKTLTKPGLHVDSPRLSPDGQTMVYLENCLHSSTFRRFSPGTYDMSRRLIRVSWNDVKACMDHTMPIDSKKEVVIGNSQMENVTHPYEMPDGTTFYGLYPWMTEARGLLPERIFSEDGNTVFLSIIQISQVTLMAVDLTSHQITIYPLEGYELLDVHQDVILAQHSTVKIKPTLRIGRLHDDYFTTTSTTTTTETTTDSTTTESTTTTGTTTETTTDTTTDTTTVDPCEHLKGNNTTTETDPENNSTSAGTTTATTTTTSTTSTTTEHPHATPLRLASVYFKALGPPGLSFYTEKTLTFEKPDFRESTCPKSFFTATYSYKKGFPPMALVVLLHGGPHKATVRTFSKQRNVYLDLGLAVLEVNYRGSTGMGDESLQALVGNVGEMAASDVHQATQFVLKHQPELLPRVALVGHSFGGFIATTLAAKHPDKYNVIVSNNGWLDPSATRNLDWYLHGLRGVNYTKTWTMDKDMLTYWWDRSPLRLLPSVRASTLLVAGEEDPVTPVQSQAMPYHRGLLARGVPTRLVNLPGEGHHIQGIGALRTVSHETLKWVHTHWGTYEFECALYEMSTDSSGRPVTTTTDLPEFSTTSALVSGAKANNFAPRQINTLASAILTLCLWRHLVR